jgi:DNA polymerase-3 subunit epsilon
LELKLKKPIVFFDLETTGTNLVTDKIVECCFIKVMPNGEEKTWYKKINPGIPIPAKASAIHGIFDQDVKDAPKFNEIGKTLAQFLEGCDLAGYNILKFDLPMLIEEFLRANIDFKIEGRNLIDAQKIFHIMEPRTLSAAYKFYCDKTIENAHSAEADTRATLEVLFAQVKKYQNIEIVDEKGNKTIPVQNDMQVLHKLSVSNSVDLASRFVYNEQGVPVVNFGKHKDKTVSWVLKNEPQYYDWFMKSDFPLESKRKFTELKLKESNLNR